MMLEMSSTHQQLLTPQTPHHLNGCFPG